MLLKMLKQFLASGRELEMRKQVLVAHTGFDIKECHEFMDTNKDGNVSANEFQRIINDYAIKGTSADHLNNLLNHLEKDGDLSISLSKFEEYCTPILKPIEKAAAAETPKASLAPSRR